MARYLDRQDRAGGNMAELACVLDAKARIAESPVWYPESQSLYWTDIHGYRLNRLDVNSGRNKEWTVKEKVSSFAICDEDMLVVALHSGFALIDLKNQTLARIAEPFDSSLNVHLNDGRCDRSPFLLGGLSSSAKNLEKRRALQTIRRWRVPSGGRWRHRVERGGLLTRQSHFVLRGLARSPDLGVRS